MDPLTIAGSGGTYVALLLILILWSLAIRADERGANVLVTGETNEPGQDQPRPTRNFLSRIRTNELLVLQCLSMVGVPLLMIAFSVAVPALRNPLFLMIGALAGFVLGYLLYRALGSIEIKNPFVDANRLPLAYSVWHYLLAGLVALTSSVAAGYMPARKAASVHPVDIIRGAT